MCRPCCRAGPGTGPSRSPRTPNGRGSSSRAARSTGSTSSTADTSRSPTSATTRPALLVAFIDGFAVEGCAPELIDIDTAHEIIDTYTLAFLLTHVAGDTSAEANLTPEYAETIPEIAYDLKVD